MQGLYRTRCFVIFYVVRSSGISGSGQPPMIIVWSSLDHRLEFPRTSLLMTAWRSRRQESWARPRVGARIAALARPPLPPSFLASTQRRPGRAAPPKRPAPCLGHEPRASVLPFSFGFTSTIALLCDHAEIHDTMIPNNVFLSSGPIKPLLSRPSGRGRDCSRRADGEGQQCHRISVGRSMLLCVSFVSRCVFVCHFVSRCVPSTR